MPLNSKFLTCLSNLDSNESIVSIKGGLILNTIIPKYSSGGNNLLFKKCLSKVNIILDSDLAKSASFLSVKPMGLSLISYPSCNNNSFISLGKFSLLQNSMNFDSHQKLKEFLRERNLRLVSE